MPVSLFTGLPGSGKTASLVKRIVDLRKAEPGRPIFQYGINGLKDGLAATLTKEQLEHWWEECPPGSIICIDECQEDGSNPDQPICLMPKDRGAPSPWVQKITKVRHYGMDFLLTTQHPANMSAYVRRLVDFHQHAVMRSKGVRQTFTWGRCIDDPDNRREKKTAEMSFSSVPKEVFDLYKSSSLHTMKVRVPRIMYLIVAGALVAGVLAFLIPHRLHQAIKPAKLVASGDAALLHASDAMRLTDYVKWTQARVAGLPWTAPMFDQLKVVAQPRLFCISVADGTCHCVTEQGTDYDVAMAMCRQIALHGVYNPFLPPPDAKHDESTGQPSDRRQAPSAPAGRMASTVQPSADAGGGDPHGVRATATPYKPPTYGAWDPTPIPGAM